MESDKRHYLLETRVPFRGFFCGFSFIVPPAPFPAPLLSRLTIFALYYNTELISNSSSLDSGECEEKKTDTEVSEVAAGDYNEYQDAK